MRTLITVGQAVELVKGEAQRFEEELIRSIGSNDFMEALEFDIAAKTLRALAIVMEVELE